MAVKATMPEASEAPDPKGGDVPIEAVALKDPAKRYRLCVCVCVCVCVGGEECVCVRNIVASAFFLPLFLCFFRAFSSQSIQSSAII